MRENLHPKSFVWLAASVGLLSASLLMLPYAFSAEGYHTFTLFGARYGIATLKGHPIIVLDARHIDFPFYRAAVCIMAVTACAAILAIVLGHFHLSSPSHPSPPASTDPPAPHTAPPSSRPT